MPHTEDWCWVHHWFAHWAFVGMCYYARYRRHHGGQAVLKIVFYPEDKGKSLKDFRLGSTFLRSAFENFIWLQCEQWMVREGCHLLPYLKNTWATLEAFGRWAGGRKYLLHTGEANLPDVSGSFQTPRYLPVLLSVPTLHTASKATKATEDKQPNY